VAFPGLIKNSVQKRKAEFLCGRYAAIQALKQLGFPDQKIDIGKNREPMFPQATLGSITHNNKIALSLVGLRSDFEYLGVDLETIIDVELISQIQQQIISAEERMLLDKSQLSFDVVFTLVFSAKESIFKALHPGVGEYFDFETAKLIELCPTSRRLRFVLTQSLAPCFSAGSTIDCEFHFDSTRVLTVAYKHRK